jgi:telomerase reverse transcriptase
VENNHGVCNSTTDGEADEKTCFMDMACSTADVSAFCRAVAARVIPNGFWGGASNKRTIMYWIDQFVSIRRFESLTLHQVTQKIEVSIPPMFAQIRAHLFVDFEFSLAPDTWS